MQPQDDDQPVGRVLSRREILQWLGGGGALLVFGGIGLEQTRTPTRTPTPTPIPRCIVKPELAEGPFFVDTDLERVDLRLDPKDETVKEGTPLLLAYHVTQVSATGCQPIAQAQVDVWHCDADGVYSGVAGLSDERLWLRGYQITDQDGIAQFLTIVPGWYPGRAVHIHFKLRVDQGDDQIYEFSSQVFFHPETIETIYADEPYHTRGLPNRSNEQDGIYRQSDGVLTLDLTPMTDDDLETYQVEMGYRADFAIGLDLRR